MVIVIVTGWCLPMSPPERCGRWLRQNHNVDSTNLTACQLALTASCESLPKVNLTVVIRGLLVYFRNLTTELKCHCSHLSQSGCSQSSTSSVEALLVSRRAATRKGKKVIHICHQLCPQDTQSKVFVHTHSHMVQQFPCTVTVYTTEPGVLLNTLLK